MNWCDIFTEYSKEHELIYPGYNGKDSFDNKSKDVLKKLSRAFQCFGIYELDWLKTSNGKEYDFFEEDCEYIFYLIDNETSQWFKDISVVSIKVDEFDKLKLELKKLFNFAGRHIKDKKDLSNFYEKILSQCNYSYWRKRYQLKSFFDTCFYLFDDNISINFETDREHDPNYLTEDDRMLLYDELLRSIITLGDIAHAMNEYRDDEVYDVSLELEEEKYKVYSMVNSLTAEKFLDSIKPDETNRFEDLKKSRNLKSIVKKSEKHAEQKLNIHLEFAKNCCKEYGLDYNKYLEQKDYVENRERTVKISSRKLFNNIKKENQQENSSLNKNLITFKQMVDEILNFYEPNDNDYDLFNYSSVLMADILDKLI